MVKIRTPKKYPAPFLSIGDLEWTEAYKDLTPAGFGLYLLLAENKSGYNYGLSKATFMSKLGKGKHAYYDARDELIAKKYLRFNKENGQYEFYPTRPTPKELEDMKLADKGFEF